MTKPLFAAGLLGIAVAGFALAEIPIGSASNADNTDRVRAETLRLRDHFRVVERELLARDVSALSDSQRAARSRNIAALREYREAGVFPHNHEHPGGQRPYFRDEHGTLCAMAFLIDEGGGGAVVERVASGNNNAYIRELAGDQELIAWLDANGLSVEEAARIQPAYGFNPGDDAVSAGYAKLTAANAAVQGGVFTWNLLANPGRSGDLTPGITALLSGAAGIVIGMSGISDDSKADLISINLVLGGITSVTGVINTVRAVHVRVKRTTPPAEERSSRMQQWSPLLSADLNGRTQLGVNLRF